MNRKQFLSSAGLMLAATVAGCGGGSGKKDESPTLDNPSGSGIADLSTLNVQPPAAYSGYIGRGTTFVLAFPSAANAPITTQVDLIRYLEARGGEDRGEYRNNIVVNKVGDTTWNVRRDIDMDAGGVYYLDVRTNLDRRRYVFTVDGGRAAATKAVTTTGAITRGIDVSNGSGSGSLDNLTLRWSGDSAGSYSISVGTDFLLTFPSEAAAPANFTVRLRRYKEGRGDEGFSDDEQAISVSHDAGTNYWTLRRRDNFRLESAATYIVEVDAPGEPYPREFAFITEG